MPKDEGKKKAKKGGGSPLKSKAYRIEGGKAIRLRSSCPKCGEGVFLADHKDRQHCGSCGYSRWKKE